MALELLPYQIKSSIHCYSNVHFNIKIQVSIGIYGLFATSCESIESFKKIKQDTKVKM